MSRAFTIIVFMGLSVTNANAEDWTSIIKDDVHEVLVDIDSYNVSQKLPYLTAKTVYKTAQTFDLPRESIEYFTSITILQFNCQRPLYRAKMIQLLNKKNKLIDTIKINSGFSKIPENTDTFAIGQLTCQVHQMIGG